MYISVVVHLCEPPLEPDSMLDEAICICSGPYNTTRLLPNVGWWSKMVSEIWVDHKHYTLCFTEHS